MDWIKKLLIGVTTVAVLLLLVVTYLSARMGNQGKIFAALARADTLRDQRDSITRIAAAVDSIQAQLESRANAWQDSASALRVRVDSLERARRSAQLGVRLLRTTEQLERRLKETFPEVAEKHWRVTEIVDEDTDIALEFLMVPVWFSETFIIDHQNAESYRQQSLTLEEVVALQDSVRVLGDSILVLEEQRSLAFETGYRTVFGSYEEINRQYVAELKKPRLSIPSAFGLCAGAAGVGVLAGILIQR